ncbi:MAG: heavy metal translocating P-type ATPase [Planctomycetaceae bacterium]|nr:heavy metal translocating P-type ATPase [Planctomycetaceae bacterium]
MLLLWVGLVGIWPAEHWLAVVPLWCSLVVGGLPLIVGLLRKLWQREFGSDLLAGISIVVAVFLGEYLAGVLVVLMLSGGAALESYAIRSASSVLLALSRRLPLVAHRRDGANIREIPVSEIRPGDQLLVFPHESCPVDGVVIEGQGVMDESYLTGEPFQVQKSLGSAVISGAINGELALVIRAEKRAADSRYAQIMQVMKAAEQDRPHLRRLGDKLGAWYTPLALIVAGTAWFASGDPVRFLSVLVVATPCPLLIAIPVAIIGSISLAAKRAIIVRNPSSLELADTCRTIIFDKTGTLTYGMPNLVEILPAPDRSADWLLAVVASLGRYSKHPLSAAIVRASEERKAAWFPVSQVSEKPGAGMTGQVGSHLIQITSRRKLQLAASVASPSTTEEHPLAMLPPETTGLECVVLVDGRYGGTFQFRDTPRSEGGPFIQHLLPRHRINRTLLVSGDRDSEVQYLARQTGIKLVFSSQSPEQKLAIVREETKRSPTIFVGDGINDAPALTAATVGIAFGQHSDVTSQAADVVVLDCSLQKVDEFLHISGRMRQIALQSALGGIGLSLLAMGFAFGGYLNPVWGAMFQELIDVFAVLNALRVAWPAGELRDF